MWPWPKLPLPNKWELGLINGIQVDANNHLWLFHTPEELPRYLMGATTDPPTSKCCVPAPAVIEFSETGDVLRAWGDPTKKDQGFEWPTAGHGIYIDYKGNVWIAGSATRPAEDGRPADGLVLKFDPDGKLLYGRLEVAVDVGIHGLAGLAAAAFEIDAHIGQRSRGPITHPGQSEIGENDLDPAGSFQDTGFDRQR